ncbi:MAG: hypothetical protein HZB16_18275 [Armatimonadetes bacterium]|nr:hypothetical protein [Armatimonadota bacterium]
MRAKSNRYAVSSRPAPPAPAFYTVNDRPVQLVPTGDGGLDVLALDMVTGRFVRAMNYLSRCIGGAGDVDSITTQAEFDALVAAIRARIAGQE